MKIKVFYPNEKGHIELTKEKLEDLLNEAYNEGYRDGKNSNYYCYGGNLSITTPYVSSCAGSVSGAITDSFSGAATDHVYGVVTDRPCTISAAEALSNSTKDLVDIDTLQISKVSAIDCSNSKVAGICEDIAKNATMVEYEYTETI